MPRRARTALFLLSLSSNRNLTTNWPSSFHYHKSSLTKLIFLLPAWLAGMRPAAEHTYRLIDNKHCPTHMALSLASNHPRVLCQHDFLVAQQPRTSMAQVHLPTRVSILHQHVFVSLSKVLHTFSLHMSARQSRLAF